MKPKLFFRRRLLGGSIYYGVPAVIGVFVFAIDMGHGDILRGGGGGASAPTASGSATAGQPTPADTSQARINAQDSLARTTNALAAVRAMQDAARASARTGGASLIPGQPAVPNGLGIGGLNPAANVATDSTQWAGAELPTEQIDAAGLINVGVRQTAQQALLEWQTFNVGKETTITFDQSEGGVDATKWVAFNRVNDPSSNPSQILGKIAAQGQVYIINPNGVIFGGSSQVNVNTLTISSLPINTNLIDRGLLNNPDSQFLFSGLAIPAGANGTPSFTPTPPPASTGQYGDVTIQAGARIETSVSDDGNGGRVFLAGPNVTNSGTILTPRGQTILAAGLQVGVSAPDAADPSLRGLVTYVGQTGTYGGSSKNTGLISSELGAITLVGKNVHNAGALEATTSVSLNGRIDLLAHTGATPNPAIGAAVASATPFLNRESGIVTLGSSSVVSILPEYDSNETAIGTRLALRSRINMEGRVIHVGKDSTIHAPNALARIAAGEWLFLQIATTSTSRYIQSAGQIYIDQGALLDVAGTVDVQVPVSQNFISVDLRGAELADSPVQRTGPLRGQSINVDIRTTGVYRGNEWIGTPLGDVSGFAGLIERDVAQLTTEGGSITLSSGESIVIRDGSRLDVSGGSIAFQGGVVETTKLISNGRVFDISQALPDIIYDGVFDGTFDASNPKWGVTELYRSSLIPSGRRFEAGYTQGANGGSLTITSPAMALDGTLLGATIQGERQRSTPAGPGSLALNFTATDRTFTRLPAFAPTPPAIIFQTSSSQSTPDPFEIDDEGRPLALTEARRETVIISTGLAAPGNFTSLTINNPDGSITIPLETSVNAPFLGSLALNASNLTVEGRISAPGGSISLRSPNLSLSQLNALFADSSLPQPQANPGKGVFVLGQQGEITTAGLLLDDRSSEAGAIALPVVLDGGSVRIEAFDTHLKTGGRIDVSGGARADGRARITYGNGGSISISGGRDPGEPSVIGGALQLGATLEAYSFGKGGSLSLSAVAFQIGGETAPNAVVHLDPEFFNMGGFASFSLSGIGIPTDDPSKFVPAVLVEKNTRLQPAVRSRLALAPAGRPLGFSTPLLLPEGIRSPISLTFNATGARSRPPVSILARGEVVIAEGSHIETDARGSVTLNGETTTVLGSITSPGGNISVTGADKFPSDSITPLHATVAIGPDSILDASGETLLRDDPRGLRVGNVLPGGKISISGNIVAHQGSLIVANGASGILDLTTAASSLSRSAVGSLQGRLTVATTVESNGGSISLEGGDFLHSDAILIARAGGDSANGGTLNISSSRFVPLNTSFTSADINLVVTSAGSVTEAGTITATGQQPIDENGNPAAGLGRISVATFSGGGFHNVSLEGNVRFEGDVTLALPGRVRLATGGVMEATGKLDVTAAHLYAGQSFRPPILLGEVITYFTATTPAGTAPFNLRPTTGSGNISLAAGLIDLGTLSLQNISTARFNAPTGDIRGNGTLQAAGNLTFTAGQIYPTTASDFNIFAYENSSITFNRGTDRQLPLTAGGSINVHASIISQNGTLRTPHGVINLGWNGSGTAPVNPLAGNAIAAPVTSSLVLAANSVTSVSGLDPITGELSLIPYGITFDGNSWIDPSGQDITNAGPPNKDIKLSGLNLNTAENSVIDISGGGDLFAYRWVEGNNGTTDVLASADSFAIIPGYSQDYAPYATFNPEADTLSGTTGYLNASLRPGDKITIGEGAGSLPGGSYTLLPARFALLPGAFLVTPSAAGPVNPIRQADGSFLVSGYRSNDLNPLRSGQTSITGFEIASAATFLQRAEYQQLSANTFFSEVASERGVTAPRLPSDAGILSFTATQSFALAGSVFTNTPKGGRGALIDINSPVDILINATGTGGAADTLVLSSALLNTFSAESLLIGGIRTQIDGVTTVTTSTRNLTLDNGGAPLVGSDIILTARESLRLEDDAGIIATGSASGGNITLGNAAVAGSGNGALVRVSGDSAAGVSRLGVTPGGPASLTVGRANVSGGSIVLDSTSAASLSDSAILSGNAISISSGEITLALDNAGEILAADSLVLAGATLDLLLGSANILTFGSYSNFNIYGTGQVGSANLDQLNLSAANFRGFNQNGGNATFSATSILINNRAGLPPTVPVHDSDGQLVFSAGEIILGANAARIDGFANVSFNADSRIATSSTGSLFINGDLRLSTPLLTGLDASRYELSAAGDLTLDGPLTGLSNPGGLGADLSLTAASIAINGGISLPSGRLSMRATSGDILVGNSAPVFISLSGTSQQFVDVSRHTSGGTISLVSDTGSIRILEGTTLDVSAPSAGGNAGEINLATPGGSLELSGTILGHAGDRGSKGRFTLDTETLASTAAIDSILNSGGFTSLRDFRIRDGDVLISGNAVSAAYRISADSGDITVTGSIVASGTRGGTIDLKANGSLTLASGAVLDASALTFDAAGKGGTIVLEAGSQREGVIRADAFLNLGTGSSIYLAVAENDPTSASLGKFSGTLHLRAPRTSGNDDVRISAIGSSINGVSAITVEGYRLYDLTGTQGGTISSALQTQMRNEAAAFLGAAGTTSTGHNAILSRLSKGTPGLDLILTPGLEIINRNGNLTLGTSSSTAAADWDLSSFRFGPRSAPGVLTLRASGDLKFFNALSDGFSGGPSLWLAPLMVHNPLLPANSQSWSYHLTAGADLSAASFREVVPLGQLAAETGDLELGKNAGGATAPGGSTAQTSAILGRNFQVIRTGSGDIDIHAANTVRLLNPFASIYTAGTQVADPTGVFAPGDFVTPILARNVSQTDLGSAQQNYAAQFSMAGGNVSITAGANIERKTENNFGLIDDSSRQMPNNWLLRRGVVDSEGKFGSIRIGTGFSSTTDAAASTSWWVDYSNFFQSVGALGGGNVSLAAGSEVRNIDAAIPTNARAPRGTPSPDKLIELGGGDLRVKSGGDISGGVFYVERGHGTLEAGGAITTNATRSPSFGLVGNLNNPASAQLDPLTWLPTTLFVGKSSFDLLAAGDLLLGPVSNPFLLPQGLNNRFWYKTHFSTYSPDSSVSALSLGGELTYRNAVTLRNETTAQPMLRAWHQTQLLYTGTSSSTSFVQPWLRLTETSIDPFSPVWALAPATVSLTSLSADLNLVGNITSFPSASGQIEFIAGGSVNALQPTGRSNIRVAGESTKIWTSSTVSLPDTDPRSIPGALSPLTSGGFNNRTLPEFLSNLDTALVDSGSITGINATLQAKQARHTPGGLHEEGADPLRIHALSGNLSGLSLFSAKQSHITAGANITDVAFYIQNNGATDTTVVSSGGDIILSDPNSPLRIAATSLGNALSDKQAAVLAGDIQIAGPGALHILAGRNLDLGIGASQSDGTGSGISSIGNFRNTFLPSTGAGILILTGSGADQNLDEALEIEKFLSSLSSGEMEFLLTLLESQQDLSSLDDAARAEYAVRTFFSILRDTGRDFNDPESPGFGNYDRGFAAIRSLLGETDERPGEIFARARDIRTRSGGDIRILAPGGGLTLANTAFGNPLAPPGIITEAGGSISIFTEQSVDIGIGRIFTLRGGDAIIWSSKGDIAAGTSSRTVQSAPPTRVIIDPQSGSVETDLAGLATGGGIGVLATVRGVDPGDVDLIAPSGTIDAGDAGIRVTGNINLAAVQVVNAGNIAAGGTSTGGGGGTTVAAPAPATIASSSNTAAGATAAAAPMPVAETTPEEVESTVEQPSLFTVEVIGYGGASDDDDDEEDEEEESAEGDEEQ